MYLSSLQQHILLKCWRKGGRVERNKFGGFYLSKSKKPNKNHQEKIIAQSLERLINRGFLIGYGRRTAYKWFITYVKLTKKGCLAIQSILKQRQRKLPFK